MTIAISQRVIVDSQTGERRDALDQRWPAFLAAAGLFGIAVPNRPGLLRPFLDHTNLDGVLLTGGNDPASLGGDAPERDEVEAGLIAFARDRRLPLLGVCRGMQMIQSHFGVTCRRVEGHVTASQRITFDGREISVNSYHRFGSRETAPGLTTCGNSDDGVVKAVRADGGLILGIMWHPERMDPARVDDLSLFGTFFGAKK